MIGELINGRYRIECEAGSGGMADVYKAHDLKTDRTVALKVIKKDYCRDPKYVRRFEREAQAVIAIFGIAWMGDTFLQGNMGQLTLSIEGIVQQMPWLFGVALFVMSILLYSQAATVRALVPLGIALGISPYMLIALFPAVNGYFFIPNYPTVVAAINFDRTGTTKIGKYVLNHSFMMPGLVSTIVAIALGLLFIQIF